MDKDNNQGAGRIQGYEAFKKADDQENVYKVVIELEKIGNNNNSSWEIKGNVRNKETQEPLSEVLLLMDITAGQTDINGNFCFSGLNEGEHKLTTEKMGYKKFEHNFVLPPT